PTGMEKNARFPDVARKVSEADINDAVQHSRLQAFEIANGSFKMKFELGAPESRDGLSDCYFLGPPLPLDGKIYALAEKRQELWLICIDPTPPGKVITMQMLMKTRAVSTRDKQLCPASVADSKRVLQLLSDLDSDVFQVRRLAQKELEKMA